MLFDGSLEDLWHGEVPLLVDIHQDQQLEVAPGPACVPAGGVVEQVEGVVAARDEVGEQQQRGRRIGAEEVRGPAAGEERVEGEPGVHHSAALSTSGVCCLCCSAGDWWPVSPQVTTRHTTELYCRNQAGPGSRGGPGQCISLCCRVCPPPTTLYLAYTGPGSAVSQCHCSITAHLILSGGISESINEEWYNEGLFALLFSLCTLDLVSSCRSFNLAAFRE